MRNFIKKSDLIAIRGGRDYSVDPGDINFYYGVVEKYGLECPPDEPENNKQ